MTDDQTPTDPTRTPQIGCTATLHLKVRAASGVEMIRAETIRCTDHQTYSHHGPGTSGLIVTWQTGGTPAPDPTPAPRSTVTELDADRPAPVKRGPGRPRKPRP